MLELAGKTNSFISLIRDLLNDIVIPDDSLFEILDDVVDDELLSYVYDFQLLEWYNLPLTRYNTD